MNIYDQVCRRLTAVLVCCYYYQSQNKKIIAFSYATKDMWIFGLDDFPCLELQYSPFNVSKNNKKNPKHLL